MADPEVGLAVSYYDLYRRLPVVAETSSLPSCASDETANDVDSCTPTATTTVVTEETWTDQDAAQAATLLQASQDKCRIILLPEESEEESWNRFYQSHQANFFKDKHYLETDFPDEFSVTVTNQLQSRCCVEIGCGVGNAILPLLDHKSSDNDTSHQDETAKIDWTIHCLDLSAVAVDLLQQEPRFVKASQAQRAFAYCCDITQQPGQLPVTCINVATVTTLFFCLSAIDPVLHAVAAQTVAQTLAPGGVLVLRDYGRYDQGQLKLGLQRNKLVKDNFYRKHDGTKCFYFALEELRQLFVGECGLEELELRYLCKSFENRSQQTKRRRVWVSARFRKPLEASG